MKIVLRKILNFLLVYVTFKRVEQLLGYLGQRCKKMEVTGSGEEEVRHQARLGNEHGRLLCKQKLTLVSSN